MVVADNQHAELDNILQKYFTNKFRVGYISVKGVTMPKRFEDMEEDIYNLEVNENDIWICSFPKSGTTWTQEMVWMIMNNLDFVKGQDELAVRCPFLELSTIFDHRETIRTNKDFDPPPYLEDSVKFVKELESPKIVKTHLPWNLLPKQIQENIKKPKIVYVTRNPKDTCVSYYNHSKLMEGYTGGFEDFCKLFLAGKVNYAPIWNNIFSFWERRNEENILFLKYEDMIKDLPAVIRKVSQFLEKDLNDDQVRLLSEHLSFENMKNNPSLNYESLIAFNKKYEFTNFDGAFMRSGKVGDYKEKMSPELIKKFEEWTKENTKDTDLSF